MKISRKAYKTSLHIETSDHEKQPRVSSTNEMAHAITQVEEGLHALGRALLHSAQLHATDAVGLLRDRLVATETGVEKLIARVPAVGPMVAMGMYRATHGVSNGHEVGTRPSNLNDMPDAFYADSHVGAYLDEIGFRTA